MNNHHFSSYGGGVHYTALIGQMPEGREWEPGDPTYEPVIDRTARIEAYVTVDAGMERATRVGPHVWLMKRVHVGHDAEIGERCELAPGCIIGGCAKIGPGCKLGMGTIVLPLVKIAPNVRVGAGAVVTRDIPTGGGTWAGVPAKRLHAGEVSLGPCAS